MTEPISSMFVHGNELHLTGEHMYCHYVDNKEQPFYVSKDRLFDLCPITIPGLPLSHAASAGPVALLACGDRALRVVVGKVTMCEVPLEVLPTSLCPLDDHEGGVVFGTACGRIGSVTISAAEQSRLWLTENPQKLGAVTAIAHTNALLKTPSIVVGHECGTVTVWILGASIPHLQTLVRVGSAVTSVAIGVFSQNTTPDVIVGTYSGAVVGFAAVTHEEVETNTQFYADRLVTIATEVASLKAKLKSAQADAQSDGAQRALASTAKLPELDIRASLTLDSTNAAYLLTLELAVSIEMITFLADVDVSLIVASGTTAAVACNSATSGGLLACYTCEPGTTRLQFIVRSAEGQYGTLEVSIVPQLRPRTCCRRQFPICALSLHERVSDTLDESLPLSTVVLEGQFGAGDIHTWLGRCFSDLSPTVSSPRTTLVYVSTLVGTSVEVVYEDGHALLRSDCLTTLAILRDTISKEATLNSVHMNMSSNPNLDSVPHCLRFMIPKFEYHLRIAQQFHVLDPLKELVAHENNIEFLTFEQQRLLEQSVVIEQKHAAQPHHLRCLHDTVVRLYSDMCAFQRRNPKGGSGRLGVLLQSQFTVEDLIEAFAQ